jgi:hypothetical protein
LGITASYQSLLAVSHVLHATVGMIYGIAFKDLPASPVSTGIANSGFHADQVWMCITNWSDS